MIAIAMILFGVLMLGVAAVYWHRNGAVYDYVTALNDEIYRLDTEDIHKVCEARLAGDHTATYQPSWRREEENTVSYDAMVSQVWRPLSSFYRDGFPAEPPLR